MTTTPLTTSANYPLTLLFDGACPVCNLEMDNLKARNQDGLLAFVDISSPQFDPAPFGTSLTAMNGWIHAAYAVFAGHRHGFSRVFMPLLNHLRRWRAEQRAAGGAEKASRACHRRACDVAGNTATPATHKPTRSSS